MKKSLLAALALACATRMTAQERQIFIYSPDPKAGLHAAYMDNDGQWKEIGQLCASDYGPWGSDKKMFAPSVVHAADGTWRAVWQVSDKAPCFAAAYSRDLISWRPQDYPRMTTKQCLCPVVFETEPGKFDIYYRSERGPRYVSASADFRRFTADQSSTIEDAAWTVDTLAIDGKRVTGQVFSIGEAQLDTLVATYRQRRLEENADKVGWANDKKLYAAISSTAATLTVNTVATKPISDKLMGVFFEDISYAADGGLYAELVQNRDFEYSSADRKEWTSTTAWHASRHIRIATDNPLSTNNPHYAIIAADTLVNDGWDGIADKGARYDFSLFARVIGGKKKRINVAITDREGNVLAQQRIDVKGETWQRYEVKLATPAAAQWRSCRLRIVGEKDHEAAIDMVSLFPENTFKGRKNGLRADLAQAIADLHPKFVRFPGGCMSHGQGIDNIYHWQETIGPLQDRKPAPNIWKYHQTRGLGFYEYFQFCEDIGAEPLPVLSAGVPCQNSHANADGYAGQQGGITMDKMPDYCQEVLHLIEWANGDPATSQWARRRAEAGHPEPFNLKYIGIGNEDLISTVFEERFEMIARTVKKHYPGIILCGTVGPFHAPSADYLEGWDFARRHSDIVDMVDEHYYENPGWFINNANYYDNYSRKGPKVYLGEWASKGRKVGNALVEALYLSNLERNADVVRMASYAPLLAKDKHNNWNPNLIYFSNTEVRPTASYEVQRLFSIYGGDTYVESTLQAEPLVKERIGASVVRNSKTGKTWLKLVNVLPLSLTVNVDGIPLPERLNVKGFEGNPDNVNVKKDNKIGKNGKSLTLPPYSIRVVEL